MNPNSDPHDNAKVNERELKTLHQLADAAKAYRWSEVLKLLRKNPEFINSTRPGGKSQFTPLHQAAHGGADLEVIQELLNMGASLSAKTTKDDLAVNLAEKKNHLHLVEILQPLDVARLQSTINYSDQVNETQVVCALRFNGYDYEEAHSHSNAPRRDLSSLVAPIVGNLVFHTDQNDNFAAFFGLQRFLFKWGGEYLSKYAAEHIAFDFLFLHLYRCHPPTEFCNEEYCRKWDREFHSTADSIAAIVRKSFRRVGEGQRIFPGF